MTEKLKYLVLDTGAFIKGNVIELYNKAENIVTISEVIGEIRDSKARDVLERLPFEVELRNPSVESIKAVLEFAQKTGDFASLSKTDMKVIALTHMLEKEVTGSVYTLPKPKVRRMGETYDHKHAYSHQYFQKEVHQSVDATKTAETSGNGTSQAKVNTASNVKPGFSWAKVVKGNEIEETVIEEISEDTENQDKTHEGNDDFPALPILRDGSSDNESNEDLENESINEEGSNDESDSAADGIIVEEDEKVVGNSTINDLTSDNDDLEHIIVDFNETCNSGDHATHVVNEASLSSNDKTENKEKQRTNTTSNIISRTGLSSGAIESSRLAQEDTGEGWINVSNIVDHKLHGDIGFGAAGSKAKKNKKRAKKKKPVQVACITTDFSMQNVLMQMRLNIFSIDGLQIHSVKQWVLRCMACYQIHYDMDRLFCRNCGIDHLSRVSASIDNETGELKLHLKKNYKVDTRGTKYSLPNPGKQNRYKGEILLREDQLLSGIWRQKVVKINKDVKSVFGEDITSDLGLQINKSSAIRIGLGKNNPNSAKGRERRGKKKK